MTLEKNKIISIIILLFVVVGIPFAAVLSLRNQDIRKSAQTTNISRGKDSQIFVTTKGKIDNIPVDVNQWSQQKSNIQNTNQASGNNSNHILPILESTRTRETTTLQQSGITSSQSSSQQQSPTSTPTPIPASRSQSVTPTPAPIPGDINNDKRVNLLDYNSMLACIRGTCQYMANADLNKNGKVDIFDYNLLLKYLSEAGTTQL